MDYNYINSITSAMIQPKFTCFCGCKINYGSVKKLGDEPILHLTWVDITNETFDIYWTVNIDTGLLIPVERPIV